LEYPHTGDSPWYRKESMQSSRQDLLRLLAHKSFRLGEFKLSSGGTSDYYIDCRSTTLDAKGARLTGEVFADEIRQRGWKPQAIGGLTMGADPIVVAVSVVGGELNGFLVRKAEKQHGTGQRIEGFREKGARVVIVDDVCTTGASTVQAIEAAREFGFEIVGVMCLVEREEAKGRPSVEKAAAPASFVSIFTARDVRAEHVSQTDDTAPVIFAVAAKCEICGAAAVTNVPRNRCAVHRP
jgi:orotate phosphoribosyltransferase